jgi:hypothetical protein
MARSRWRLRGARYDFELLAWGDVAASYEEPLSAADALRALDPFTSTAVAWTFEARTLRDVVAHLARQHPVALAGALGDVGATLRAALAQGLLRVHRRRALALASSLTELDTEAVDRSIPLASELLDRMFEKGVEVESEVRDDFGGGFEVEETFTDDDFGAMTAEEEVIDDDLGGMEAQEVVIDRDVEGADPTLARDPARADDTQAEGAEVESEVDDDELGGFESETEVTESVPESETREDDQEAA